jgi:acyl-ACP thioesterase
MSTYEIKNSVHYYEINIQRQASPMAVLNFFEETAVRQSEACGYGIGRLIDQGLIWILTNWSINMERYPGWMENVLVETRVCKFERFYAFREFKIRDEQNNILGTAVSRWIFYDLNRNRPVRVPLEIAEAFGVNHQKNEDIKFAGIEIPDSYDPGMEFRVRLSDIDTNNHVNNTRYVEWMLEAVPFPIHQAFFPASLEVAYKKEAVYGEDVLSEVKQEPDLPGHLKFCHRITEKVTGAELARAITLWKKALTHK